MRPILINQAIEFNKKYLQYLDIQAESNDDTVNKNIVSYRIMIADIG